jgi:hypothetical protein
MEPLIAAGQCPHRWGSNKDGSWRCVDGGAALFACTSADAPDLDAVGFVPGKPWCMAAGATSFVGACK